jgi:hypothetical protein
MLHMRPDELNFSKAASSTDGQTVILGRPLRCFSVVKAKPEHYSIKLRVIVKNPSVTNGLEMNICNREKLIMGCSRLLVGKARLLKRERARSRSSTYIEIRILMLPAGTQGRTLVRAKLAGGRKIGLNHNRQTRPIDLTTKDVGHRLG